MIEGIYLPWELTYESSASVSKSEPCLRQWTKQLSHMRNNYSQKERLILAFHQFNRIDSHSYLEITISNYPLLWLHQSWLICYVTYLLPWFHVLHWTLYFYNPLLFLNLALSLRFNSAVNYFALQFNYHCLLDLASLKLMNWLNCYQYLQQIDLIFLNYKVKLICSHQ